MRVLITGAQGFVGRYMVRALERELPDARQVVATARVPIAPANCTALDVTDSHAVDRAIADTVPSHVVHLAGLSTIAAADENQELAWRVHVHGTLNLARAIMRSAPDCVLIHIGSGQIYGATGRSGAPLNEESLLAPTNIQMVTKSAADLALGALAEDGLKCIRFRPFNHTGPGQNEHFALPNFAMQIARIKTGKQQPLMRVGNLDTERDFLDVRDVVSAYLQAVLKSDDVKAGTIFNVASGIPRRMRDVLMQMFAVSGVAPTLETTSALVRPTEIKRFVGDAARARRLLGWTPTHPFEQTIREIIEHWERVVQGMAAVQES